MAGLCAAADLAIGAGGSSVWERCAVGLSGLTVVLAPNQEPGARALASAGACEVVDAAADDFEADFDRAFTGLLRSPERRARMGRAAAGLCDGEGAARAAEAFLEMAASSLG
jgi:spore coat polysaccharide biosynthesis predicted glycosyltransferase SpsG